MVDVIVNEVCVNIGGSVVMVVAIARGGCCYGVSAGRVENRVLMTSLYGTVT